MESTTIRLSLEELALAILVKGRPGPAADLLAAMRRAGVSKDAVRAYARAAQHSLMARGLLDAGTEEFAEPLLDAVSAMLGAATSIAYRRATDSVLFYFGAGDILEQRVEQRVIHTLSRADGGNDAVLHTGAAFFGIDGRASEADLSFEIGVDTFGEFKNERDRGYLERCLTDAGVPAAASAALAEDLHAPAYRGEVVHATHGDDGVPRDDRTLLVLGGAERAWLLCAGDRNDKAVITVTRATEAEFYRQAGAFLP